MTRRLIARRVILAALMTPALPRILRAQAVKPVRVGWLTAQTASSLAPFVDAFRAGLADLNYREGRTLTIEFRYGDNALERVPDLAAELVRLPVDVIVAQGAAVSVISTLKLPVPVVYVYSGDPVSAGFATSLAHPRGNMTGLTFMAAELNGKRLELLREIMPDLRDVAIVANPEHPGEQLERAYSENAARQMNVAIDYFPASTSEDLNRIFSAMTSHPPQAISLFADGFAIQNRKPIIDFATAHRIAVVSGWPVFAQSGALFTYGPRLTESYRRLASYVDRVLKGTKPADLPIERPTTFQLVVNMRAAKILDLTIPETVLARADDVLE